MVHMLASHLRSEFLATPDLIRFDMPYGKNGLEPTLLIKANSLSLKYLLRRKSTRLILTRIGKKIAYAVEIPDDPDRPAAVWSLLKLPNEAIALKTLLTNPKCVIFLFNELAISVAWTELNVQIDPSFEAAIDSVDFHIIQNKNDTKLVGDRLDEIRSNITTQETQILNLNTIEWHELQATYITNRADRSDLSLFSDDEGGQQEEIAVWLTDSLHPKGCVKSPQVQEKSLRELCDILLSYEFGSFLIESKSLNILTRETLPDRKKLTADLSKHINKATRQLSGGIRNLKIGSTVEDRTGKVLHVEREKPAHAIILVPDLSLLQDATEFGAEFTYNFMEATGGYLHILDPAELLRMVQAAEMIAENSDRITKMMAFDWYLIKRMEVAIKQSTPYFAVLFRKDSSGDRGNV